jgi:hypothetical protein
MKKNLIVLALSLVGISALAQPVTAPIPPTPFLKANAAWYRGGNVIAGAGNVLGFQAGNNSQVWFLTNGFSRMMMDKGGSTIFNGRMSMSENLPGAFIPNARLHLHQATDRTSLLFTNGATGVASSGGFSTDGFEVGIDKSLPNPNAFLWNFEKSHMFFATSNLERMRIEDQGQVGINTPVPANRLEIRPTFGDPYFPANASGLRLSGLPCTAPTVAQCNPLSPVFLSVDGNGDVILVNGPSGGSGIGAYCPTVNNLTGNYLIPFANNNVYFDGQGVPSSNAIGVGYNCTSFLPAKFNVAQANTSPVAVSTTAGYFINRDLNSVSSLTFTAIYGNSSAPHFGNVYNIGADLVAGNAAISIGVRADATGGSTSFTRFGGQFTSLATASGANFGVYGEAANAGVNYGVYGKSPTTGGTAGPNFAGFFDGDLVYTGAFGAFSDQRLKKDIKTISNVNEIIEKLNPVTYNYRVDEFKNISLSKAKQYGFISQEVEKIMPELVMPIVVPPVYDAEGKEISPKQEYKGLNYIGFIALLTEAVKEQQKQIEELKTLVENSSVTNPNGENQKTINSVNLADIQSIILDQNVPNPFAEQTTISYTLTKGVQKAQMLFYNEEGKLINSSELKTTAGKGQLNVFANDLSNGIYTYTLVVDGKIIDSKRMVKSK